MPAFSLSSLGCLHRVTPACCSSQVAGAAFQCQVSCSSDILTCLSVKVLALSSTGCSTVKRTRGSGDLRPMGMCLEGNPSRKAPDRLQATLMPHSQDKDLSSVCALQALISSHQCVVTDLPPCSRNPEALGVLCCHRMTGP